MNSDPEMPGPGAYEPTIGIGKEGQKFSIKGRTVAPDDVIRIVSKQAIPGPGTYAPKTGLDNLGVYCVSNLENSKTTRISPRGLRFQIIEEKRTLLIPGPGSYNPKDYADVKHDRVYYLSQYKNPQTRRFGTAQRQRIENKMSLLVPGPGQYRPPSEFGYVELFKSPRTQQSPRARGRLFSQPMSETDSKSRHFASTTAHSSPKRPRKFVPDNQGLLPPGDPNSFSRINSHMTDGSATQGLQGLKRELITLDE